MSVEEAAMSCWRHVAIIAVLVAYPAVATEVSGPVQWKKSHGGNGHWYEAVFVPQRINWVEAQLRATARGGCWHLVTITSEAEDSFVFSLIANKDKFFVFEGDPVNGPWLGGFQKNSKAEPDGKWRWVTDEKFKYTNWDGGEPNNNGAGCPPELCVGVLGGSEDFLHYKRIVTGNRDIPIWNDSHQNALLSGYILEREISPRCGLRRARE
jgi:hypothetical protein